MGQRTSNNPYWPRLWAESPSLLREARKMEYLVIVWSDGKLSCKACGKFVPWEPQSEHFARHMAELDSYLARKEQDKRDETAEGFYPKPCSSCGNPIPRTGKSGRPPSECDSCKFPFAASEPGEEAILTELGL